EILCRNVYQSLVYILHFTVLLQTSSTLYPYTTLFRSQLRADPCAGSATARARDESRSGGDRARAGPRDPRGRGVSRLQRCGAVRESEEHTSELQSRENLVCRLLLAKKNEIILECDSTN